MDIQLTNIKPANLNPNILMPIGNDTTYQQIMEKGIVDQMFQPLIPGSPISIKNGKKKLDKTDIIGLFCSCTDDVVDPKATEMGHEILDKTLASYEKKLSVDEVFSAQAGKKEKTIFPSPTVIYTPTDVIDASKQLLASQISPDAFFAVMAFYTRVKALGYYFANEAAWEEFKTWFHTEVTKIQNILPPDTWTACCNLQNSKLSGLTKGLVLRDTFNQNNDKYSFARVFQFYLNTYIRDIKKNNLPEYTAGMLPFSLGDVCCPRIMIIVNVEKHAHAYPSKIKNEWEMIQQSMTIKPSVLGLNKIANLTALAKMTKHMIAGKAARNNAFSSRSAEIRFRKSAPTGIDLYKYILKIYKHTDCVLHSENALKATKMTYNKPSRRRPDDPDAMGKSSRIIYKPDLHIYLDCSGSICEDDYRDAIKSCMQLAKKMGVNFYFNSFSHKLSAAAKLHVKDRSIKQIYNEFRRIPKVSGGTDYEQIWHYINQSNKRGKEVSILITDFEYGAPNHYVKHPRFLYYAPISGSDWKRITTEAKYFTKSMLHIAPDIRRKILM